MEEYVPKDYKKIVKSWFAGLSEDQRTVIYSGTKAEQDTMWEGTSFRDQLDFWERLHWRFKDDGSVVLPGQEEDVVTKDLPPITMDSDNYDPEGLQMPVQHAPTEMGWKAPKPTPIKLSEEINEVGAELIEIVEEEVTDYKVEPRKSMPGKVELDEVPDFDDMNMRKLRKYAQDKGIKTGGKKKSDIILELKKAYQ